MPPKRDSSTSGNNASSNINNNTNETPTTSATNNSSSATAMTSQTNATNSSTITLNTTTTTTAAAAVTNITLPMLLPDAAAEQRTIAYQANAKLCRLVRKCPWMYDRNHHNYAKKHILDKSWCKIARECNDSVASCKERWRNIRAAFARSINIYKTHSGPNRVKPYYLHKELSFLVRPMMEGRDKKDDYDEGTESGIKDEDVNAEEADNEDEDDDEEEQADGDDGDFPDDTAEIKSAFEALNPDIRIQAETRYQRMLKNNSNSNNDSEPCNIFEPHTEFTTSDAENEFHYPDETLSQADNERRQSNINGQNGFKRPMHFETETIESKKFKCLQNSQGTANENDIKFLEALLPDMALMNTRQKIVFKKKIYQTLEEVFENSNDFPNIEQTKMDKSNSASNTTNNLNYNASSSGSFIAPQVKQTILTVNSSTARNLINNIANLNEAELQKVNGFLQNSLRSFTTNNRLTNGTNTPSSAAAKLMCSTPKITITKVPCPPPAALRTLHLNKPPSPSTNAVSTTIHHTTSSGGATIASSSNVHSTTSSFTGSASNIQPSGPNANQQNSPWNQVVPITIKDEIEDVDIV